MTWRPTAVEPVNEVIATSGCPTRWAPATGPVPVTTLTTPAGAPASVNASAKRTLVSGVISAGLSTMVLPAAMAGSTFHAAIWRGEFHGAIEPTTPIGSRRMVVVWAPGDSAPPKPAGGRGGGA